MKIVFERESKHEGNDCMIYESAFVVQVEGGFVATRNAIYIGWMGFDTRSQSFVYSNLAEAIDFAKCSEVDPRE